VLTNEKYIGNNVYNRVSFKLKAKRVVNDPDMWVRADGAFEGIVDPDFFEAAQRIIFDRSRRFTDQQLLEQLSLCSVSAAGSRAWSSTRSRTCRPARRSGTASAACFAPTSSSASRRRATIATSRPTALCAPFTPTSSPASSPHSGRWAPASSVDPHTDLLHINDEFTASLVIVRCAPTPAGQPSLEGPLDQGLRPDITIAARMASDNATVRDYYLLPWIDWRRGEPQAGAGQSHLPGRLPLR
jgi:hypothetical protein